jgi:hypothetical protein
MIADGGKSEVGMLNENRACSPDGWPVSEVGVATSEEESAENKVTKIGKKIRQKSTTRRRGGRISGRWLYHNGSGAGEKKNQKKKEVQKVGLKRWVFEGSEGRWQEDCMTKADGSESTNPTVGVKQAGCHSSGAMSSTAGQEETNGHSLRFLGSKAGKYRR